MPLVSPTSRFVDMLLHRDDGSTRAALVRNLMPEAWQTYKELREAAGCDDEPDEARAERSLGESVMLEWARASQAATAAREAEVRMNVEAERRVIIETERVRTETEARLRAEFESRLTPRSGAVAAVRSATRRLRRAIAAVFRGLGGRLRRTLTRGGPQPLPLPQDDAPETVRRAA